MKSMEEKGGNQHIRRFGPYRIVEHLALIVIFLVLAMTGLPQKFYHLGISQSVIVILGGIDNLRLLHHLSAMLFIGLAAEHVIVNFVGVTFMDWEPSMLVTLKDAQDSFQNVRYYLGLTHEPAGCGRYTYKEKGIYWFVLIGSVQMIITGLVLWFPVAFTRYLPGIFVPLSKMVHTSEAMLIFMLVVTWHIYDSMLNPDVFPINKSIFTGYIGTRQMKRLHPMESATLREEGSADQVDRSIPV